DISFTLVMRRSFYVNFVEKHSARNVIYCTYMCTRMDNFNAHMKSHYTKGWAISQLEQYDYDRKYH
ncbi:hypothetical protein Bhyg_07144, partial [Pseudolycoriella hygida]